MVKVELKKLENFKELDLPAYETNLAAGVDLRAAITDTISLAPGERTLVATGFAMALPPGYEAQIRPRSGLAYKHGISVVNTPLDLARLDLTLLLRVPSKKAMMDHSW